MAGEKTKRTTVRKGKVVLPKAETNLRGTTADKIISPTVKGLKESGKAIKAAVKKASKKLTVKNAKGALKKMKPGNKGLLGKIKPKPRKQRRMYTNNTYTEGE